MLEKITGFYVHLRLSKYAKEDIKFKRCKEFDRVLNKIALREFLKPVSERRSIVDLKLQAKDIVRQNRLLRNNCETLAKSQMQKLKEEINLIINR